MFNLKTRSICLLIIILTVLLPQFGLSEPVAPPVRNVILYLATGMGEHQVKLLEGISEQSKQESVFDQFDRRLRMKTAILTTAIPDTNGGASTLATGIKCPPNLLSLSPEGKVLPTIFERAQEQGRSVGMVTLGSLTNGAITPFIVHTDQADDFASRAQQIVDARLQVLVGGDRGVFESVQNASGEDLLQQMANDGYEVVKGNGKAFNWAKGSHVAGFFDHHYRADRRFYAGSPNLQQILFKTFSVLNRNPKGFFLVVETPSIEEACRMGDPVLLAHEMLELQDGIKAGLRFAKTVPNTLVVVVSPHETGNFMTIKDQIPQFSKQYDTVRCSPVLLDQKIGTTRDVAAVLKSFRDIAGIDFLESYELSEICRTPAGPERVRVIAGIVSHHIFGGQFAQNTPSGRSVPCFITGPGSADWPEEIDNNQVATLLQKSMHLP